MQIRPPQSQGEHHEQPGREQRNQVPGPLRQRSPEPGGSCLRHDRDGRGALAAADVSGCLAHGPGSRVPVTTRFPTGSDSAARARATALEPTEQGALESAGKGCEPRPVRDRIPVADAAHRNAAESGTREQRAGGARVEQLHVLDVVDRRAPAHGAIYDGAPVVADEHQRAARGEQPSRITAEDERVGHVLDRLEACDQGERLACEQLRPEDVVDDALPHVRGSRGDGRRRRLHAGHVVDPQLQQTLEEDAVARADVERPQRLWHSRQQGSHERRVRAAGELRLDTAVEGRVGIRIRERGGVRHRARIHERADRALDHPVMHVLGQLARAERERVEPALVDRGLRDHRGVVGRAAERAGTCDVGELHCRRDARSSASSRPPAARTSPPRTTCRRMNSGRCFTSSKILARYSPTRPIANRLIEPKKSTITIRVVMPVGRVVREEDAPGDLEQTQHDAEHEEHRPEHAQHVQAGRC